MLQRVLFGAEQSSFVRHIPLFSGLTEKEKDAVLKDGCVCSCPRKRTLFRQGDSVTHFYVICGGTVRLSHVMPHGREITTDIRLSGDTLCATEILGTVKLHHAHAVAIDDVTVMEFPKEWLREIAQRHSTVSANLLSSLSQRAHRSKMEIAQQATMSATQLVACFLQSLCEFHGFDSRGFDLPYSKTLIASRLGMELETLSRTLPKLKEYGITVRGAHVSFQDLQRVEQLICGDYSVVGSRPAYKALRPII